MANDVESSTVVPGFDGIVGSCPAMQEVFRLIPRIAATNDTVLITGETGTGKELVARSIHRHSLHSSGPFVDVNCAAIPTSLFESEFFGHERGAFTDAREAKPGKFELAHRGSLFLDEIGELPRDAQAKLLRVLDNRQVMRVGGVKSLTVDARLIAATNVDLEEAARSGRFRADLFYRLSAFTIHLPALRHRGADVALLIDHYLIGTGINSLQLSVSLRQSLLAHTWPGNARELEHYIRRALLLPDSIGPTPIGSTSSSVTPELGPTAGAGPAAGLIHAKLRLTEEYETKAIRLALVTACGNQTAAAASLGISPRTLYSKMAKFSIRNAYRSLNDSSRSGSTDPTHPDRRRRIKDTSS